MSQCVLLAHAYLITPKGANRLLKACPKASYHVDMVAWGKTKEIDILAIHPLVAWQTFSASGSKLWPADPYTGNEIKWLLSYPSLRVGGSFFGGRLVLTTGSVIALMVIGFAIACITKSAAMLGISVAYTIGIIALVNLLSSNLNR